MAGISIRHAPFPVDEMAKVLSLNYTIRNLKRYAEIIAVLVRHGFEDIIQEFKLDRFVERGMTFVGAPETRIEFEAVPRPIRLRRAFEELGPTFVKLGQVLSTRPDLIDPKFADELKLLQDSCAQVPYDEIRDVLERELGDKLSVLFQSIDPRPLAAASMAQTHRAVYRDGSRVVLKVLRPSIRETAETDIEILRALASFVEERVSNLGFSPMEVVSELAREMKRELDLSQEAKSTDKLRGFFEDDPGVMFPEVYWEGTTRSVLTLQEIDGIPLSRLAPEELPPEERKRLVRNGANAVLRQCLEIGFFHADPHPGNLFAMPGGVVCFIDCGMVGQIDRSTAVQLADLVLGIVRGDTERVIGVVSELADVSPDKLTERRFRADVRDFIQHFDNTPLEKLDVGEVLREFFEKLRAHGLRCPGDLVLLIKALTTIESIGKQLDPEFDMVSFTRPHVEALVGRNRGPRAMRRRLQESILQYGELVEELPLELRHMLSQLRKNRLALNLEHRGLPSLTRAIERAGRNIANAALASALLVGSSIMVLAADDKATWHLSALGVAGFVLACLLAILIALQRRDRDE